MARDPSVLEVPESRRAQSSAGGVPSFGSVLKVFASLRLTVALLGLTMVLVFAGTSVQKEMGIWDVQRVYFHSFFVMIDLRLFTPLWPWGFAHIPGAIPMPGGYSLIGLLLLNLLAAHSTRFKFRLNRAGLLMTHAGLILLILGEVATSLVAREGQMVIDEGQTVRYTQDIRAAELAITDPSPATYDDVVSIPVARLARQDVISYPTLPFAIRVKAYFANSVGLGPFQAQQVKLTPGQREIGGADFGMTIRELPKSNGVETKDGDAPAALLSIEAGGKPIGSVIVSLLIDQPETISVDGHPYSVQLRWKRSYKPYALTLLKFSHDVYTGTADASAGNAGVPRNFASLVRLVDPEHHEDREAKIWMNHPLRYGGETFYQASFRPGDKTTILQVVDNPAAWIPYVSCTLIAVGLIVHLGIKLLAFLRKPRPALRRLGDVGPGPKSRQRRWVMPVVIATLCVGYLGMASLPPGERSSFHFDRFARVPLSYEGRVMPMGTLARVSLRIISGRSDATADDGKTVPAIRWLADVFAKPEAAQQYKIFRIDQPDVLSILSLDSSRTRFSYSEIMASAARLDAQLQLARSATNVTPTLFQAKLAELAEHLQLFQRLSEASTLFVAPPTSPGEDWRSLDDAAQRMKQPGAASPGNPGVLAFAAITQSYAADDADAFNAVCDGYLTWTANNLPSVKRAAGFEEWFNRLDPFVNCMALYVIVFLLVCASWLIARWNAPLQRAAFWLLVVAFAVHTFGLVARIYMQGRPPVTNLYSSAVFIGWGAVLFCLLQERIFRNGVGSLGASIIAFPTLVIAHYLSGSGDTMQMLQAVLDTNIWLATHVVVVTLGYAATFLAGSFAIVYVVGAFIARGPEGDAFRKSLVKMTYAAICFAMLFSFVGTVLGGIWADQSWGRFWGWDPKENGAVLIVLWNAIVLHARFGGIVRERGMMLMAIAGNIVTSWSWFGTNMMGVGLHSYGFMQAAVTVLSIFVASQLLLIAAGLFLPLPLAATRGETIDFERVKAGST